MYNFGPGVVWSGLATYTDAMAAIKKLVFDDKKYTLKQLNEALKADFEGYDQINADCLAAPKYGNDDDYADLIAADLINFTEMEHRQYKTLILRTEPWYTFHFQQYSVWTADWCIRRRT